MIVQGGWGQGIVQGGWGQGEGELIFVVVKRDGLLRSEVLLTFWVDVRCFQVGN